MYQDVREMYPGIRFACQGTSWKEWVKFMITPDTELGVVFALWEGREGPGPNDARANTLRDKYGLPWQSDQRLRVWSKLIESRLSPGKAGLQLVNDVAQEMGAIINGILIDFS